MKLLSRVVKFRELLIIIPAITLLYSIAFAEPDGQLYWEVDEYPGIFSLYDVSAAYQGAGAVLEYACVQEYGNNYVKFQIEGIDSPALKRGRCYYHTFVGTVPGKYYDAFLYCNEVKRDEFDISVCESSGPLFTPENNFGPPPTCSN